jgi:hypothetical protein
MVVSVVAFEKQRAVNARVLLDLRNRDHMPHQAAEET